VNCSTTRCTMPAADPPTGRGEGAHPPRVNPLPFVPLPTAALHDPRLDGIDRDLLGALLEVARNDASCFPSIKTLAGLIQRCERTVQYHLQQLVRTGWVRLEPCSTNTTGRIIVLCWREGHAVASPGVAPPVQSAAPPLVQIVAPPPTQGVAPPVQPAAPHPVQAVAPDVRSEDRERNVTSVPPKSTPRPLADELKTIPGADQSRVRAIAWRLAHHLADVASVAFFTLVLGMVAAGSAPVERLLAAFQAGSKAKGRAQKPGAIFAWTWKNWQPPPKPSEINRPKYSQVPSPAVRASPSSVVDQSPEAPLSREEEIVELKSWLAQPRHPFAAHARRRLVELGVAIGS
jgi:hypothetical protein